MSANPAYSPGQLIGGTYLVKRVLGSGGMGTVYDAEDTSVGKRYAVKTLHPHLVDREEHRSLMRAEGRALAKVQHPHIVDVITAGTTRDHFELPFIVMEWLDGANLRAIMNSASLSQQDVLKIATELLDALYHMHEGGADAKPPRPPMLHRDIKPENIFLAKAPDGGHIVKVLDLGIAVLLDGRSHGVHGTPKYMAPEQLRDGELGPRTDLYQAACVFYELLAGRHPFMGARTASQQLHAHLYTVPPRISRFVNVPPRVDDVLAAALSKDPAERPRDAYAFMVAMRDLKDYRGDCIPAPANTTLEDLKTAIERQTESGYDAYATAPGALDATSMARVVAHTIRMAPPVKKATGTVPMAPPPVFAVAQSPISSAVDRSAPTRSRREPVRAPHGTNGTEELLEGLITPPARRTKEPTVPAVQALGVQEAPSSAPHRAGLASPAARASAQPPAETPFAASVATNQEPQLLGTQPPLTWRSHVTPSRFIAAASLLLALGSVAFRGSAQVATTAAGSSPSGAEPSPVKPPAVREDIAPPASSAYMPSVATAAVAANEVAPATSSASGPGRASPPSASPSAIRILAPRPKPPRTELPASAPSGPSRDDIIRKM